MKCLIIGCGNIGAFYDFDSDDVKTYAKAFKLLDFDFEIYDNNHEVSNVVCEKYNVKALRTLKNVVFSQYEIVVIATPTDSHAFYLKRLMMHPPKLIVCEKPVSKNLSELLLLEEMYMKNNNRIFINYQRSFQPKIIRLKNIIRNISSTEKVKNVVVTYQGGLQNNASHALDLLSYLLGLDYDFITNISSNDFNDDIIGDPTISFSFLWNEIQFSFIGLPSAKFALLDIDIYFRNQMIELSEGCNKIKFKKTNNLAKNINTFFITTDIWSDCMRYSMKNVILHIQKMLCDDLIEDNFLNSVKLSHFIASSLIKK